MPEFRPVGIVSVSASETVCRGSRADRERPRARPGRGEERGEGKDLSIETVSQPEFNRCPASSVRVADGLRE